MLLVILYLLSPSARLAQSAERKALNLVVVGSSPTVGVFLSLCGGRQMDIWLSCRMLLRLLLPLPLLLLPLLLLLLRLLLLLLLLLLLWLLRLLCLDPCALL